MASLRDQVDAVLRDQEKFAKDEGCGVWVDGSLNWLLLSVDGSKAVAPMSTFLIENVTVFNQYDRYRGGGYLPFFGKV